MKRSRRASVVGIAAIALVAMACGSTLPNAEQVAAVEGTQGLDASSGLPPGAEINSEGQIVNEQGEVIGTTSGGVTTSANLTGSDSGGELATTGSTTSAGANGPGVTDRTISLGLAVIKDQEAAYTASGIYNVTGSFDLERAWKALIEYQNSHGGIAGRRIVPVFHSYDFYSSETYAQQEQEACAQWTEEHQVFLATLVAFNSDNLRQCMADAGGASASQEIYCAGAAVIPTFRRFPHFIAPNCLVPERIAEALVDALDKLDYFAEDAKLGLVTWDSPGFRYATQNALIPALRRRGISVTDVAYLYSTGSTSADYGQTANEAANAALKFKSEGIDHVVFLDECAGLSYLFTTAAEKQAYRPRYGLHQCHQYLADLLGDAARSQLQGALGIDYSPAISVRDQDDPQIKAPSRELCLSIMRKAGVKVTGVQDNKASAMCDTLWSLAAALEGASVINQATFLAGINSLHGRYSPGTTWSTFFDPTHHYGVSSVANVHFVESCTCFKYLSRPYAIR